MSDPSPPAAGNLLAVNESLSIPRNELDVRVSRASGAGGQHVNKTSSRVEIFWNIPASRALTDEQRFVRHVAERKPQRERGDADVEDEILDRR